ncbi:MAG: SOS response-associated peptidase [Caldisericia bacterium]
MPGRLVLTYKIDEIYEHFKVELLATSWDIPGQTDDEKISSDSIVPRYNISPSQNLLCVVGDEGSREIRFMKWGLVPFWAKDVNIGNKMINARSETVSSKPAFRNSFKRKRCIIPITGFYEWKNTGYGAKRPYYFKKKDDSLISFAGLWESWTGDGKNHLYTCTIMTTEPNKLIGEIHDRMGLILPEGREDVWLAQESSKDVLKELMKPYEMGDIECFPVSTFCNSPENDSPECIVPDKRLI